MNSRNETIYVVLFIFIAIAAIVLRLWDLGDYGFWTDELYHAISARSIIENASPAFPGGGEYTRALGFTHVVTIFFKRHVF